MDQGQTSLRGPITHGRFPGVSPDVLKADLLSALDRREIEVLFQPQFSCFTGAVVGAEALARWRHPSLGPIGARDRGARQGARPCGLCRGDRERNPARCDHRRRLRPLARLPARPTDAERKRAGAGADCAGDGAWVGAEYSHRVRFRDLRGWLRMAVSGWEGERLFFQPS